MAVGIKVFSFDGATLNITKLARPAVDILQKTVPLRFLPRYQPPNPRELSGILLGEGVR